jgi:hypothetical protein
MGFATCLRTAAFAIVVAPMAAAQTAPAATPEPAATTPAPAPEPSPAPATPAAAPDAAAPATAAPVAVTADVTADTATTSSSTSEPAYGRKGIGIEAAASFGFAVPSGNFVEGQPFRESFDGHVPLRIDLGYRITSSLVVGVYGVYGPTFLGTLNPLTCGGRNKGNTAEAVGCSATVMRAGLQVSYHFTPHELVDPWAGVGIGVESIAVTEPDTSRKLTAKGMEIFNASLGLDVHLATNTTVGPFMQVALGKYTTTTYECGSVANCTPVDNQKPAAPSGHQWYTGGVRRVQLF